MRIKDFQKMMEGRHGEKPGVEARRAAVLELASYSGKLATIEQRFGEHDKEPVLTTEDVSEFLAQILRAVTQLAVAYELDLEDVAKRSLQLES